MRVAKATKVRLRLKRDQAAQVEITQRQHAPSLRILTAQANDSDATSPQGNEAQALAPQIWSVTNFAAILACMEAAYSLQVSPYPTTKSNMPVLQYGKQLH
jgi:hypothetical protein